MRSIEFIKKHARYVHNAVSPQLCEESVALIDNEFQFEPCNYNTSVDLNYRDCSEVKITDKCFIDKFWDQIKEYIPSTCDGEALVGPHYSRVYMLRYVSSQFFKRHYDGYSTSSKGYKSKITVLIYLNNMVDKYSGSTRFYSEPDRGIYFPDKSKTFYDISPRIGSMVMFTHKLLHEGMPIKEGYKYCIRFNILYTPYTPSVPKKLTDRDTSVKPRDTSEKPRNPSKNPGNLPIKRKRIVEICQVKTTSSQNKIRKMDTSNGLKYEEAIMKTHEGIEISLTYNPNNIFSKNRWTDVLLRPHVFEIQQTNFRGFMDTNMGRPPTPLEDFCPNCYEILLLEEDISKCSGCLCPVMSVDKNLRSKRLGSSL